jgi:glutathione S-transferase
MEIHLLKLFYSPGACSIAAHIALEIAQADYVAVRAAIANGENSKPEFLAVNPQGRVPALAIGDTVITELPAILFYVDRAFPKAQLMPEGAVDHARAASMMAFLSSNVHISFATIWRPERFTGNKDAQRSLEEDGLHRAKAHFELVETRLPHEGWLSNSPQPCLADLNLLPFYRFGLGLDLPMAEFSRYTSLVRRAEALPAVRRVLDHEKVESFFSPKRATL